MQPTAAGWRGKYSYTHGALCTQHVSLNNACMWAVCKWFRRNNGHLTLQIWTLCIYHIWGAMYKAFLKASSKPKYISQLSHTGKNTGKIFCRTKLSRIVDRGKTAHNWQI